MITEDAKHMRETRAEAQLEVRSCSGFDELEACVALQVAIWGYDELDVIPRRMFTVAQRIGGQVMGAFAADDTLAGFAMSIPGIRRGAAVSALAHAGGSAGVPQRRRGPAAEAGAAGRCPETGHPADGVDLRSARDQELHFSTSRSWERLRAAIHPIFMVYPRLGFRAGVRRTGCTPSGGWTRERVVEAVAGRRVPRGEVEIRIELPHQVMQWKESAEGAAEAMALQRANQEQFAEAFGRGLAVTGFSRDQEGNGWFELSRWTGEAGGPKNATAVS